MMRMSRRPQIVRAIIEKAAARGIHVLLIAEALSPILLHQLLRAGRKISCHIRCRKTRCTTR